MDIQRRPKRPYWIDKKLDFRAMAGMENLISDLKLHTVCNQARCPNISECFSRRTATFLILGDICTRNCKFCNIKKGIPQKVETDVSGRIVKAAKRLKLRHIVITSVTRDDLEDGGASVFGEVIRKIDKNDNDSIRVEVLTPDFKGNEKSINKITAQGPDVFGHNIETVPSLYRIRDGGDYQRSLHVLEYIKKSDNIFTKSALMLGLGEKEEEVIKVFEDLRRVKCDFLTIGQYLQPDKTNYPVKEYIRPDRFDYYKRLALNMGFEHVESGVYARSSYMADRYI